MAGSIIRVDTDELQRISNSIKGINQEMKAILDRVKSEILGLRGEYEGPACDSLMDSINSFSNIFPHYESAVEEYSAKLLIIANSDASTENTNKTNHSGTAELESDNVIQRA